MATSRRHGRWRRWGLTALAGALAFLALPVRVPDAPRSTVLWDRDGRLLDARVATDGQWRLPGGEVPDRFVTALLEQEDRRFFAHPGIDPVGVGRALRDNLAAGRVVSGGSTLTMQLQRIAGDGGPRTLGRKAWEALLALRLEVALPKEDILALYAAHAPMGGNVVGVQAAAWRYFGRAAEELSWAEAATLAVLPNQPGLIHPGRGRDALKRKRDALLERLVEAGHLDADDARLARLEPIPPAPVPVPHGAPHLLAATPEGRQVASTVDGHLQARVAEVGERHRRALQGIRVEHLAVVVVDVATGEVRAWLGNVGEEGRGDAVDVARRPRSSGSILKPLLYEAMLAQGELLPDQLVPDVPMRIGGFAPTNYDRGFDGALPASRALERSRNVPAVWMLRAHGVGRFRQRLLDVGLTTLHRSAEDYGLSLILGGAEVRLDEVVDAYRQLSWAAQGLGPTMPAMHLSGEGDQRPVVMDRGAAWWTLAALEGVTRPGLHEVWRHLQGGVPVAWKTGTSMGFRDAWAVAATPEHAVGVWVGNASGEGRAGLVGLHAAAPVLFDVLELLDGRGSFERPDDALIPVDICVHTGMRAGPTCGGTRRVPLPRASQRAEACPYCEEIFCNEDCSQRLHRECAGGQAMHRETRVALPAAWAWFRGRAGRDDHGVPPWGPACGQPDEQLSLLVPSAGAALKVPVERTGRRGAVVFRAEHGDPFARVHWHLDGSFLGTTEQFHELAVDLPPGEHLLTLVDQSGAEVSRTFEAL